MEPTAPTRRLSAISMGDVVDTSRMMGADEEGTEATLAETRGFASRISKFHGRVDDGDSLMAGRPRVSLACIVALV